ncbi:MAG TPA: M14 family zinc carboxypeptidase, partial [Terriglobales bacterium]|nr:M14 family zinc carboxypeptidase [Terriglobales bacterium]
MRKILVVLALLSFIPTIAAAQTDGVNPNNSAGYAAAVHLSPSAVSNQPNDEAYTEQIRKFTTEPYFTTELVDHLPASKLPTPLQVLGHISGAPNVLTYSSDIYKYFRALEAASPRVKVLTIGRTEEGREIIMALISSEENIRARDEHRREAARLADPRGLTQQDAEDSVKKLVPLYWITGSIHSVETGSPDMLMELAYRLAADESPMYQRIRQNWIVGITPVIEVDGRDRMVDIYNWHLKHPNQPAPQLVYWGHYVVHDNNRDAMGLSLKLTQTAMKNFLEWHPLIMHDLHESVPYLYDNTLGTEPFNAWLDPIVTNEWEDIAWYNVNEMAKRGLPGVFAFGTFTTWDPSYLYFIANSHNSIGRLYETFGNGGADTRERELSPSETERTWWRPNPPLAKTLWSQRDNNNYQESAILFSLDYLAGKREDYVRNFYLKSVRAVEKAKNEGPAAYVFPADDPRPQLQAELLNLLQQQGAEVQRATQAFRVTLDTRPRPNTPQREETQMAAPRPSQPATREFSAGSYIVRMDQPYSRIADMLLDQQYYSPDDRRPYDDSGWSQGPLRNTETVRVSDLSVLSVPTEQVKGPVTVAANVGGSGGAILAIQNNATPQLASLRFALREVPIEAAEGPFTANGTNFNPGTYLIPAAARGRAEQAAHDLGLSVVALDAMPRIGHHILAAPRIAILHTWTGTQNEGWYRMAFENMKVPYTYISDQKVREARDGAELRSKFDVIVFPPVGGGAQRIVHGVPMWNPPLPWENTALTPNLGKIDSTPDMRGGMGLIGLEHLHQFVEQGGLLITVMDTATVPVDFGLANGVSLTPARQLHARGTVLNAQFTGTNSPIAYGYGQRLSVYFNDGPIFRVSYMAGGGFGGGGAFGGEEHRATGRGNADSPDVAQGRPAAENEPAPQFTPKPWEAPYMSPEATERTSAYVIPEQYRPRVVLRFADARDL